MADFQPDLGVASLKERVASVMRPSDMFEFDTLTFCILILQISSLLNIILDIFKNRCNSVQACFKLPFALLVRLEL